MRMVYQYGLSLYDIIILSGGFDPVHSGHIKMFKEASYCSKKVVVGLNSDEWLMRKKGKPFMSFNERKDVLESIKYINEVRAFKDYDNTANDLIRWVYTYGGATRIAFGNGGDRTVENTPEQKLCDQLGIDMVWRLGGGKVQSSSELLRIFNSGDV